MRLVPVSTCHTLYTIQPLLAVHVFLQLSTFTVLVCAKCLLLQCCSPLVEERAQSERDAFITSKEYLSLRQFLMQQLSLICQQPFDAFRPPVTAPVFAFGTDLTMLQSINMPYFDDSTGISSAFSLPKHYAITGKGD